MYSCIKFFILFYSSNKIVSSAASAMKWLPTTCHQQAMGFITGVAAAGGENVARGVATLAPLQPLPSLSQGGDDDGHDPDFKEDEDECPSSMKERFNRQLRRFNKQMRQLHFG